MKPRMQLAALMLATLTGCGGGYVSVGVSSGFDYYDDEPFLFWGGNSSGDQVVDANNDPFAFYSDSGCLYNVRTGRENIDFCLTSNPGIAVYAGLPVRIANVRSAAGTCITALVDEATRNFIDIELDPRGREVVFVTALRPDLCFV